MSTTESLEGGGIIHPLPTGNNFPVVLKYILNPTLWRNNVAVLGNGC